MSGDGNKSDDEVKRGKKEATRADEALFLKVVNEACWFLRCRIEYLGNQKRAGLVRTGHFSASLFSATVTYECGRMGVRNNRSTYEKKNRRPTRGPTGDCEGDSRQN